MKKLCSTLFLLCMFVGIATVLGRATLNRTDAGCIQLADFYRLEEDTVDVLFVGSSHVYYSINTCNLYDDYGIASYLLASPAQPVWISYYFLQEALKTQSPRLVVFDVCTLYKKQSDVGAASLPSLISMKPSREKWKAIRAVNQEEKLLDAISAFFSFPYYHTRYDELTRQDYENTKRVRYHGYKPDFQVISSHELKQWANVDRTDFDKREPVSERTELYLRHLIELCRQKNIPLLLVNSPYLNQTEEKQKAYNYVFAIAKEYNIPFLDSNFVKEMQIDFAKDLLEPSHLNYYGSVKYTDYLAKWIKSHCPLPDRRADKRYQSWEEMSRKFEHTELYGRALQAISTASDYRNAVRSLDECVVVFYEKPHGSAAVYEDGKLLFQIQSQPSKTQAYFEHFDLGYSDLAVKGDAKGVSVMVDRKDYTVTERGWNVLVYDKVAKRVIDSAGFEDGKRKEN